jgi:hypothetical protein
MNFEAIEYAKINTKRVEYPSDNEMAFHDSHPDVRAWNLDNEEIRRGGALFNAFYGGALTGLVSGAPRALRRCSSSSSPVSGRAPPASISPA